MLGSALRHRRPLRALVGVAIAGLLGCLACARGEDAPASLHEAVLRGDIESLGSLLAAGAGTEVTNAEGLTPLYHASSGGHAELVEWLIEQRCDGSGESEACDQQNSPHHDGQRDGSSSQGGLPRAGEPRS